MQPLARKISRSRLQSVRTRSSSFQVQVAFWGAFTILLHFLASLQLESNLSESLLLDSPMASVHLRYACWAAPPAAESRLISTTINRPPLTMRAAKVAANPVEGSRRSRFSSTLVRSMLMMAKQAEEERLARGAPNQRHLVAQVAMISLSTNNIIWLRYHKFLRSNART
jgi:hypothetical protein